MISWDAARVARAAGAELLGAPVSGTGHGQGARAPGPLGASIDSRTLAPGELFVGLPGQHSDGGAHVGDAINAGAWGVLVAPGHARAAASCASATAVLAHPDPLAGLQALARAWRRELGCHGARVVAITGSTGKTSTKDILAALLSPRLPTVASPANHNTEIGLPLAVLGAPAGTRALILEMAMRGSGQIAELTAIAEPDVGVIVNVGPAHLELLGSLEAIAAAKAELIAGLAPSSTIVVPAHEPLLARHLRSDLHTITFGESGDVTLAERRRAPSAAGDGELAGEVVVRHGDVRMALQPSFTAAHQLGNLLAAVAAARALQITPQGAVEVGFSALRGQRVELPGGVVVINDCYNANPMSMQAAIDDLAETAAGRRVAVLGDMLELGAEAPALHRALARHAAARGIEPLVAVGPLAAHMGETFDGDFHSAPDAGAAAELLAGLLREGDTVLVKGSRGVGLERVAETLAAGARAG